MLRRLLPALLPLALIPAAVLVPDAHAATTSPPLMGAAAIDNPTFSKLNAAAGPLKVRRTYSSAIPSSFAKSIAGTDVAAGRASYWSFRPNPKTFASDKAAQAKFSTFLNTIPKAHKTTVIALHEPEDEIRRGDYTLAQWGAANNKVSEIVKSKKRPELRFGISLMGPWTFDSRSPYYNYKWESVLNFSRVDVVGIDPYKFRTTDPSLQQMLTRSNSGNGSTPNPSTMAKLSSWGKPIVLTQWGIVSTDRSGKPISSTTRAAWIRDGYAWMKSWNATQPVKIEAANYFHLRPAGGCYLTGEALKAFDAVTPGVPAAAPPLMGAAADNEPSFNRLVEAVGPLQSRRTYDSEIPNSFAESKAASDVAAGRMSYWSFHPDPRTFAANTAEQAKLSRFLNTIPQGHKTVVIAFHEPEDNIRRGEFTLAQWGATNNKVSEIVKSKKRPEIRFGISLLGPWTFDSRSPYYQYKWESVLNFKRLDVVGIDPYKFKFTDPSLQQILTKSNSGNGTTPNPTTMQKLTSWGKPIALTEWGVVSVDRFGKPVPDATRATWIKDGYAFMKAWNATQPVKIEAANYFHLRPEGGCYLTGEALKAFAVVTP
jgi:hypothetical protein